MINRSVLALGLVTALASSSQAAVFLIFSLPGGPILSGMSPAGGSGGAPNLTWGVIVDTAPIPVGFDNLVADVGLKVEDGADFGGGRLFFNGGTTTDAFTTNPGGEAGNGVANGISFDPYSFSGNVSAGDPIAVIWFDSGINTGSDITAATKYGIVTPSTVTSPSGSQAFDLPADGGDEVFAPLFIGVDNTGGADLQFVPIPEPSTALLAFLGLAGLLRRRR